MMYRIVYNLVDIPAEHHLNGTSSNQRPFTTIPGTTHKNYSVQDIILPTSHTPLEPTNDCCLTPSELFNSHIMARTTYKLNVDCVRFVLDTNRLNLSLIVLAHWSTVWLDMPLHLLIWSPSKKDIINKVEAVQRRAARFVTGDYQSTSSVPAMLQQFQWQTVQCRRAYAQRVMMYRMATAHITS
jgi:hypothetical protein